MKKILVVFNCSGILRDLLDMWLSHIETILNQDYENFIICISGCKVSESSKTNIINFQNKYPNKVCSVFYDVIYPVNVTFNKTCQIMNEKQDFDCFMYVASDVSFGEDRSVIRKLSELHYSKNYAITSAVVDYDSGISNWLGGDVLNNILNENHFEIPIGKTCNLHCMIFDKSIFDAYNKKILPDIFRTFCTESVFSFVAASLSKKMVIHNKSVFLRHLGHTDGSSGGFQIPSGRAGYQDLYLCDKPVELLLLTDEAKECGFGYENWVLPPNMDLYDENHNHKNPKILYDFCKKSIYLSDEKLDYKNIIYSFQ